MIPLVGNAVPGVPAAKGGNSVRYAGTMLAHRTRWNAGDGVPYGIGMVRGKSKGRTRGCALVRIYFFSMIRQNRSIWSATVFRAARQNSLSVRSISATFAVSSAEATGVV